MAGGPPHKGRLLQPASPGEVEAAPERHREVVHEIVRGLALVTGLGARPSPVPGFVRLYCTSGAMAGWLVRAIVMENVAARSGGLWIDLPAGPHFRLEKEIKNVVTAVAKTTHYWVNHTSPEQQAEVAALLRTLQSEAPLVQMALPGEEPDADTQRLLEESLLASLTGEQLCFAHRGWLGLTLAEVATAILLMRVLCVCGALARREETTVFLPLNVAEDPEGAVAVHALRRALRFVRRPGR
jgi:sirohydrochlorin cobaltochelatase